MQVFERPCPVCRARLRLRGQPSAFQTLECPDCHAALHARQGQDQQPVLVEAEPRTQSVDAIGHARRSLSQATQALTRHPGRVAWAVALVLFVGGVVAISSRPTSPRAGDSGADSQAKNDRQATTKVASVDDRAKDTDETGGEVAASQTSQSASGGELADAASSELILEHDSSPAESSTQPSPNNAAGGQIVGGTADVGDIPNPGVVASELPTPPVVPADAASFLNSGVGAADPQKTASGARQPVGIENSSTPEIAGSQPAAPGDFENSEAEIKPPEPLQPVVISAEEYQAALAIPLLEFRQSEPVSVRQQLLELEELLGVPIILSDGLQQRPPGWLDASFTVTLGDCKVEQVMQKILDEAKLAAEFREGTLHVRAAGNLSSGSD